MEKSELMDTRFVLKERNNRRTQKIRWKMESYSRKTDEKMEKFLQQISDSVGAQLHGMNSAIVKMKEEEEDDRYKQINERFTNIEKSLTWTKIRKQDWRKQGSACWQEPGWGSDKRIPQRNIWARGRTTLERIHYRNRSDDSKRENWTHREADHTCFHSFQERWRKKQIRQVSEHADHTVTRKEVENITINGRRWKISSKKNGVRQILHSWEA